MNDGLEKMCKHAVVVTVTWPSLEELKKSTNVLHQGSGHLHPRLLETLEYKAASSEHATVTSGEAPGSLRAGFLPIQVFNGNCRCLSRFHASGTLNSYTRQANVRSERDSVGHCVCERACACV